MSALHLADGPAMYLGGSIMSFALPLAAFIVIATVLYFLFLRPHHGPRLKYLTPEVVTSVQTWEPGPVPAPAVRATGATAAASAPAEPAEPAESAAPAEPTEPAAAGESDEDGTSAPEGSE